MVSVAVSLVWVLGLGFGCLYGLPCLGVLIVVLIVVALLAVCGVEFCVCFVWVTGCVRFAWVGFVLYWNLVCAVVGFFAFGFER